MGTQQSGKERPTGSRSERTSSVTELSHPGTENHYANPSAHPGPSCPQSCLHLTSTKTWLERSWAGWVWGICMDEFRELSLGKQKLTIHLSEPGACPFLSLLVSQRP